MRICTGLVLYFLFFGFRQHGFNFQDLFSKFSKQSIRVFVIFRKLSFQTLFGLSNVERHGDFALFQTSLIWGKQLPDSVWNVELSVPLL